MSARREYKTSNGQLRRASNLPRVRKIIDNLLRIEGSGISNEKITEAVHNAGFGVTNGTIAQRRRIYGNGRNFKVKVGPLVLAPLKRKLPAVESLPPEYLAKCIAEGHRRVAELQVLFKAIKQ